MKFLLCLAAAWSLTAQSPSSYRVYRADGTPSSIEEILVKAAPGSVLFLGEEHDDLVAHSLELDFLKRLHARGPVLLSLEMFERDVQYVVDEYLAGWITEEHFMASGRAWKNYKSGYRPLIEFARENHLPVTAANAPRRYVTRVSRSGAASLAELPATAKAFLPPLPYSEATEVYARKFQDLMQKMQKEAEERAAKEKNPEPPRKVDPVKNLAAQSLWDASMAYSVAQSAMRQPQATILQVNGSFHSENRLGILDHLERYRPGTKSIVVTMLYHKDFPNWNADFLNKGDFVIVTEPAAPKSIEAKPAN